MERGVAVITGASSGIGAEFARRLAPGHDVILIARRENRLRELAEKLETQFGCKAEALVADLTLEEDLTRVAERISREQRLVLLVNNAGFGKGGRFWETDFEFQEKMHRLHVTATLRLTYGALRNLVPKNTGGIINVASVAAFVRSAGNVSYGATKSWMAVFTEGLFLDLQSAGSRVVVQALCPGFTYSEFHDTMGVDRRRLASPQFWLSAEKVVEASLAGLERRDLFVIPRWQYRVLTSILTKLPTALRLRVESLAGRRRAKQLRSAAVQDRQARDAG